MRWPLILLLPLVLAACDRGKPPRQFLAEGLPIQGSLAQAQRAGFTDCIKDFSRVRCRREGVMVLGKGPYSAAVDLYRSDGSGGFYELTLWRNGDQDDKVEGVASVGDLLSQQGWSLCRTGPNDRTGDQEIYTRRGSRIRYSIDISYWGKRRLRIQPELHQPTGKCW